MPSRVEKIETLAIVVRRFDWSETSRLVHLVTPTLGKIRLMARGVHRPTSPWRGFFDHWNLLAISLRFRPDQELQNLETAELREHFPALRGTLPVHLAAHYATELTSTVTPLGEPHPGLFEAYRSFLEELAAFPLRRRSLLLAFELRLLQALGLRPSLTACALCGRALEAGGRARTWAMFSPAVGGLGCYTCRNEDSWNVDSTPPPSWRKVRVDCLRLGERLLETTLHEAGASEIPEVCAKTLRRLLDEFLAYHLESVPRSRAGLRW